MVLTTSRGLFKETSIVDHTTHVARHTAGGHEKAKPSEYSFFI